MPSIVQIHELLCVCEDAVRGAGRRMHTLRARFVRPKKSLAPLGNQSQWVDVEADETAFRKKYVARDSEDKQEGAEWEQWAGVVQRGAP